MNRVYGLVLFVLSGISLCQAQQKIAKTVVDAATRQPIGFASVVYLSDTRLGTITNEDGTFVLYVPQRTDSIEISHLGYHKIRAAIGSGIDTIYLNSAPVILNEVIVNALSAEQVIREVIENLEQNHAIEPVTYSAFVRIVEYAQDTSSIHIFEEHAVRIRQTKDSNSKFKIIKSRVGSFSKPGEKRLKDLRLINMVSIYADNIFKHRDDFLKAKRIKDYQYDLIKADRETDTNNYYIACKLKTDTTTLVATVEVDKESYGVASIRKYYKNEQGLYDFTSIQFKRYDNKWYLSDSWRHFQNSVYSRYGEKDINYTDRICIYNLTQELYDAKDYKSTVNIFAEPVKRYNGDFNDVFWESLGYLPIPNWIKNKIQKEKE